MSRAATDLDVGDRGGVERELGRIGRGGAAVQGDKYLDTAYTTSTLAGVWENPDEGGVATAAGRGCRPETATSAGPDAVPGKKVVSDSLRARVKITAPD